MIDPVQIEDDEDRTDRRDPVAVGVVGEDVRIIQGVDLVVLSYDMAVKLRDALTTVEESYS